MEGQEYGKAFLLCRQHKINLNLLYDINPGRFVEDIPLFIKQTKKVTYETQDLTLSDRLSESFHKQH